MGYSPLAEIDTYVHGGSSVNFFLRLLTYETRILHEQIIWQIANMYSSKKSS